MEKKFPKSVINFKISNKLTFTLFYNFPIKSFGTVNTVVKSPCYLIYLPYNTACISPLNWIRKMTPQFANPTGKNLAQMRVERFFASKQKRDT